jgi:SPP1 family phage portal protein
MSLMDAYNTLQSDRVNDKEQFVDAILVLINSMLGDNLSEESTAIKALKEHKILEISENGDAKWLTRTFDESSVEILRKSIEQDIHKFANVPCMTDENFVGNSSGVAMRYKMLGFEQLTKIKQRYFTEGLKRRLKLFDEAIILKGGTTFAPDDVEIIFTRSLPVNESEIASMISQLDGIVSTETLITQLPFITDASAEMEKLKQQKEENVQLQQATFGYTENTEPVTEDEQ